MIRPKQRDGLVLVTRFNLCYIGYTCVNKIPPRADSKIKCGVIDRFRDVVIVGVVTKMVVLVTKRNA